MRAVIVFFSLVVEMWCLSQQVFALAAFCAVLLVYCYWVVGRSSRANYDGDDYYLPDGDLGGPAEPGPQHDAPAEPDLIIGGTPIREGRRERHALIDEESWYARRRFALSESGGGSWSDGRRPRLSGVDGGQHKRLR